MRSLSCLLASLLIHATHAQAVVLDPGFNSDGRVFTDLGPASEERGAVVAVQPDGRILHVGNDWNVVPEERDVVLMRFLPDGSPDPTFGTDGVVVNDPVDAVYVHSMSLQPDGSILVGGTILEDASVFKYTPDGSLDADFGVGGIARIPLLGMAVDAKAMVLCPDGRIILAGYAMDLQSGELNIVLLRLLQNGSLDTSFGTNGFVVDQYVWYDEAVDLALQPDGKIIVLSLVDDSSDLLLARHNEDGTLDTDFGTAGITAPIPFLNASRGCLVIRGDGKILVGANSGAWQVFQYNPDGTVDTSFGTGGSTIVQVGQGGEGITSCNALLEQPDGRILLGGTASGANGTHMAMARLGSAGALDVDFGTNGVLAVEQANGTWESANSMVLQQDGKILLGGNSGLNDEASFAVLRFNNDMNLGSAEPVDEAVVYVFPNPASDVLVLASATPLGRVRDISLYDARGVVLRSFAPLAMRGTIEKGGAWLDLSGIAPGVHQLMVRSDAGATSLRVVKH